MRVRRGGQLVAAVSVVAVGVAVAAGHAGAAGGTTTAPTAAASTVTAAADTYVVKEVPAASYGGRTVFGASNWDAWHTEAYLRFVLPARPTAATTATLTLRLTKQTQLPAAVTVSALGTGWSESTTYATRPALGAELARVAPSGGTVTATVPVAAGAAQVDLALTNPQAESAATFASREAGADAATLTLGTGAPKPLCGLSLERRNGETEAQALARSDASFGGLGMVRLFNGGTPAAWSAMVDVGTRPVHVSFKMAPKAVLAGTYDATMRNWFATAPKDRVTYWTFYHEPEDNIAAGEFSAADYRAAWVRLRGLADQAGNPGLRATLTLMSWTLEAGSGRTFTDYYPGASVVQVLAWDPYNDGYKKSPQVYLSAETVFGKVTALSASLGLPFAVAETGAPVVTGDDGGGRAAWITQATAYLAGRGALYVAWFDLDWRDHGGPDYSLRDPAGIAAWKAFCAS